MRFLNKDYLGLPAPTHTTPLVLLVALGVLLEWGSAWAQPLRTRGSSNPASRPPPSWFFQENESTDLSASERRVLEAALGRGEAAGDPAAAARGRSLMARLTAAFGDSARHMVEDTLEAGQPFAFFGVVEPGAWDTRQRRLVDAEDIVTFLESQTPEQVHLMFQRFSVYIRLRARSARRRFDELLWTVGETYRDRGARLLAPHTPWWWPSIGEPAILSRYQRTYIEALSRHPEAVSAWVADLLEGTILPPDAPTTANIMAENDALRRRVLSQLLEVLDSPSTSSEKRDRTLLFLGEILGGTPVARRREVESIVADLVRRLGPDAVFNEGSTSKMSFSAWSHEEGAEEALVWAARLMARNGAVVSHPWIVEKPEWNHFFLREASSPQQLRFEASINSTREMMQWALAARGTSHQEAIFRALDNRLSLSQGVLRALGRGRRLSAVDRAFLELARGLVASGRQAWTPQTFLNWLQRHGSELLRPGDTLEKNVRWISNVLLRLFPPAQAGRLFAALREEVRILGIGNPDEGAARRAGASRSSYIDSLRSSMDSSIHPSSWLSDRETYIYDLVARSSSSPEHWVFYQVTPQEGESGLSRLFRRNMETGGEEGRSPLEVVESFLNDLQVIRRHEAFKTVKWSAEDFRLAVGALKKEWQRSTAPEVWEGQSPGERRALYERFQTVVNRMRSLIVETSGSMQEYRQAMDVLDELREPVVAFCFSDTVGQWR